MDTISIQDLQVSTKIGVPDDERAHEQIVKVSIWMQIDTQTAALSDDISHTIDYAKVAKEIQILGKTERKTMERFAEDIACMILKAFKPISVKVLTKKYILSQADHVAITITRP